jgi:ATP-dependent 26S proteasome regulatory subunit
MRQQNVYRGQVISLSMGPDRTITVDFHLLPHVGRDAIILPPGILERVERSTVRFAEHREKLRNAGRHLKRGILLHGPPGTGKTLTAMHVAGRMPDRTVLILTGRGQGLLEASCAMARWLAPSTVILEDVDLVAEDRSRRADNCSLPLLFELMNEMDGLGDDADVLFLLTTNRPDILEPALASRPGRVDQAIEIPLPDESCRRRLLDLYGRGLQLQLADVDAVVRRTQGVSAAFIRELLRKAALFAADEPGDVSVQDRHVEEAMRELVIDGGQLTKSLLGASALGTPRAD